MATHSSTLAWKIPWTEGPGGLQSMGLLGVGHDWATSLYFFTFMHWRRKWQPTPVFLPGESQGRGSRLGSHRVGHDWSDLAEIWEGSSIIKGILKDLVLDELDLWESGIREASYPVFSVISNRVQCCEPGLEWLWEKGGTFDRTGYCIEMLNFFLAASGVSDGMCDLWLWHTDSLVVVLRLRACSVWA